MIEQVKERALQVMKELEKLSEHDYTIFELALVLFLRADTEIVENDLNNDNLKAIMEEIEYSDTIMSEDLKDYVDNIINGEDGDYE